MTSHRSQRVVLAALVTMVLVIVVGGAVLVVRDPGPTGGDDQALRSESVPDTPVTAGATPDESAPRASRHVVDDDVTETRVAEDEVDAEEGDPTLAPGFVRRSANWAPSQPARTEHAIDAPWPPAVVAPPETPRGHPVRTSARLHHRANAQRAVDGAPTRLIVRAYAAESGELLPDASVEVLQGTPPKEAPTDHAPQIGTHAFAPLADGPLDVRIRHPGRVPHHETSLVATTGRDLVLDVHLEPGQVVEGIASNDGDVPVEGARFRMWPADAWWASRPFGDPPPTLLDATSDEDGHWRIDAAPRLTEFVVELAGGTGRATYLVEIRTGPEIEQPLWLPATVGPGYSATGRIVSVHGQPVEGAWVFAREMETTGDWNTSRLVDLTDEERAEVVLTYEVLRASIRWTRIEWVGLRGRTGSDGEFTIDGLDASNTFQLFAHHPDHGRSRPSPARAAAALRPYEAALRGRAPLVVLVDSTDGPVPDVEVTQPWSIDGDRLAEQEPGIYGPVSAEVGPLIVEARHPEHPTTIFAGEQRFGIENHVQIVLPRGYVVTGTVRDTRSRFVQGATVTMRDRTATTAVDGAFELRGAAFGPNSLAVEHAAFAPLGKGVGVPTEGPLELELRPLATVTMQLALPRGAPEPAWVEAAAVTSSDWSGRYGGAELPDPVVSLDWNEGRVEVRAVRGELGFVLVHVPGYTVVRRDVRARAGKEIDLGRIDLEPARILTGTVVGEGEGALAAARVTVAHDDYPWTLGMVRARSVVTDDEGAFRVELAWPPEDDTAGLRVVADGFVDEYVWLDDGGSDSTLTPLRVELVRGHVVRGRIEDASGVPVSAAFVGTSGWGESTYSGAEGRFALRVRSLPATVKSARNDDDLGVQPENRRDRWEVTRYRRELFRDGGEDTLFAGRAEVTRESLEQGDVVIVLHEPQD